MKSLKIKHMVCRHCVSLVKDTLSQVPDLQLESVHLGTVDLKKTPTAEQIKEIRTRLESQGFALIDDHRSQLIEAVKTLIINEVHYQENQKGPQESFSEFITRKIGYDYSYLNDLFSSAESKTIGHYLILQKIERVKELLIYGEKSISEIADSLEYSSAQYLSSQFKKYTGMTPGQFRKIGLKSRKSLDEV
ncbi:MAG: helix-turn-helix domain-containing protein [Bacteroidota bacterium]